MRAIPRLLVLGFFLTMLILANRSLVLAQNNGTESVESVEVQLVSSGKIYEGLQERIEFSIGKVGDKLLLSQPLSLLRDNKETVRTAIGNVFSKVLIGFRVDAVDLLLGSHTKVVIHLTPVPPLITAIKVNIETKGLAPELNDFTSQLGQVVENELNQVFVGLPVASVAWSDGIFNLVINYLLEREFPGFKSNFQIEPGTSTAIKLVLTARDPVISQVQVNYTSSSIPAWLVRNKAQKFSDRFEILKGIPVEFITHYQTKLENYLTKTLNDYPELRQLGFVVDLGIRPGVKTQIDLAIDSLYYQTKLEARYFVGQDESFGNLQGYLGYRAGNYEVFARCFWGQNPGGNIKIGLQVPLNRNLTGGFEYELEDQYKDLWVHYQFERGDYLDLRLGIDGAPNEALIGIYLNNNLNLELVNYDDNFGVQMMFHF